MRLCSICCCRPPPAIQLVLIEYRHIGTVKIEGRQADAGAHGAVVLQAIQGGEVGFELADILFANGFDDLGQDFFLQALQNIAAAEIVVVPEPGFKCNVLPDNGSAFGGYRGIGYTPYRRSERYRRILRRGTGSYCHS